MERTIAKAEPVPIKTCRVPIVPPPRRIESPASRRGFTLVELLAVVAILGMFASVAMLVVRRPMAAASEQLAWEQLRSTDSMLRTLCRRQRRSASLTINLDEGTCERHVEGIAPLRLPGNVLLESLLVKGLVVRRGSVTLFYRADGTSDSFGVRLPGDPETQWRFVCGGTGQWLEGVTHDAIRSLQERL